MKTNKIGRYALGTLLVLLVPLIAMQFSGEVDWDLRDFVIIGVLLMGTGIIFESLSAKVNHKYRGAIAGVLLVALFLVWAELAVGIFGTPFAGS